MFVRERDLYERQRGTKRTKRRQCLLYRATKASLLTQQSCFVLCLCLHGSRIRSSLYFVFVSFLNTLIITCEAKVRKRFVLRHVNDDRNKEENQRKKSTWRRVLLSLLYLNFLYSIGSRLLLASSHFGLVFDNRYNMFISSPAK